MSIIYVELEPDRVELNVFSNLESLNDDSLEHGRYLSLSGKPEFSGTYQYTDINLNKGGQTISLPALVSVTIRETNANPEVIGKLTYIENYSDDELGIKELDQFYAEVAYQSSHFEKAWELVGRIGIEKLKVTVAIKAPKTDISGYEAILDIAESDWWPIDALYIRRHEERT